MSIPKWASANPGITNTITIANAVILFFIVSPFLIFFAEGKKLTQSKKKPRVSGVSVTPYLRGLLFIDFLRWCKTTGFGPLLTESLK
jgi:hypothetical protein